MFRFATRVGRDALSPLLRLATRLCDESVAATEERRWFVTCFVDVLGSTRLFPPADAIEALQPRMVLVVH